MAHIVEDGQVYDVFETEGGSKVRQYVCEEKIIELTVDKGSIAADGVDVCIVEAKVVHYDNGSPMEHEGMVNFTLNDDYENPLQIPINGTSVAIDFTSADGGNFLISADSLGCTVKNNVKVVAK